MSNATKLSDKLKSKIHAILRMYNYLSLADIAELLRDTEQVNLSQSEVDRILSDIDAVISTNLTFCNHVLNKT